jgi:hypothetical protein
VIPFRITSTFSSLTPCATSHSRPAPLLAITESARAHASLSARIFDGVRYAPVSRSDAMIFGRHASRAGVIAKTSGA